MELPLRLHAEPLAREKLGACFVLPSKQEEEVCLVVNDYGLVAVACKGPQAPSSLSVAQILEIDEGCVPSLTLCRGNGWIGEINTWNSAHGQCKVCSGGRGHPQCKVPQIVVEAIERYYARQVLEPSIRGFLSILEKQFPRNDLYLFELLQNSVDDGASHVCFKSHKGSDGLEFFHNGRGFTALDVLGLASVGLSTKGLDTDGPKRTIGFMGVGFKAVYKRYAHVTIHDGRYSFSFHEPSKPIPNQPSHGWVLQPKWTDSAGVWETAPLGNNVSTDGWCRFQLESPRGGLRNVMADLHNLPKTVPALLGRQSLRNAAYFRNEQVSSWTLQWEDQTHVVTRSPLNSKTPTNRAAAKDMSWERHQFRGKLFYGGGEDIDVKRSGGGSGGSSHRWRFVTVRYSPTKEAKAAYQAHTKRPWAGLSMPETDAAFEETTLFFEMDQAGCPELHTRGAIHAVLPTKLGLPSPIQWQGSWLLSVDRQEVQSVGDNQWNACLLDQVPSLTGCLLHCLLSPSVLKNSGSVSSKYLKSVLALLPPLSINDGGQLTCSLLGRSIDMSILTEFCKYSVVPVRTEPGELSFVNSHKAVWVPPCFPKLLPASVLARWFGGLPFASDLVDDHHCWLPLWKAALRRPSAQMLKANRRNFGAPPGREGLLVALRALAALGSAARIDVDKASAHPRAQDKAGAVQKGGKDTAGEKEKAEAGDKGGALCGDWLPSLSSWPVLVDETGQPALAGELVWLSSEFSTVPPSVRGLLREGAKHAASGRRGGKGSEQRLKLMRSDVEEALMSGQLPGKGGGGASSEVINLDSDSDGEVAAGPSSSSSSSSSVAPDPLHLGGDVLNAAQHFAELMRAAHPANVVTPEEACRALLAHWAKPSGGAPSSNQQQQQQRYQGRGQQHSRGRGPHGGSGRGNQSGPSAAAALASSTKKSCEELFAWAMAGGLSRAMSHLLATSAKPSEAAEAPALAEEVSFLLPASRCLLGAEYTGSSALSDIVRSSGARGLYFVSPRYLAIGAKAASSVQKTLCFRFLGKAGARVAPLALLSARPIEQQQVRGSPSLSGLKLRSTQPSAALSLPLGLGAVNKKHVYEVDVLLAEEWRLLLSRRMTVATAQQLSGIIATDLLSASEAADPATAEACTPFAALMKGRAEAEGMLHPEKTGEGVPVPNDTTFPALKRALYLPPGQPGAAMMALGASSLLQTLAAAAWVPATAPGAPADAAPSLVLRPCECSFPEPTGSSSGSGSGDHLPRMCLPPATVGALRRLPPKVAETLAWGTVKPKPPVDRVEALLALLNAEGGEGWQDAERGLVTAQVYEDLVAVWRALGLASREGRLTKADENRVLQACGLVTMVTPPAQPPKRQNEQQWQGKGKGRHQNQRPPPKSAPSPQPQPQRKSSSSLWVLPGTDRQVLRFDQCVHVDGARAGTGSLSDEQMAALSFASMGVVFNCGPSPDTASAASWPLEDVSDELQKLLRPASEASAAHAHQALQACCASAEEGYEPPAEGWRQDRPGTFRAAYSWAVWLSAKAALSLPRASDGAGSLTPKNSEIASQRLQQKFPHLAVFCRRGPTFGPDAFHARWLPTFSEKGDAPAQPLLVDDAHTAAPGCGISRSSMLRPRHRLQPVAVLDHGLIRREDRTAESSRLAVLDPFLASCLRVARVGDNKQFTLKVATSGAGDVLIEASVRLAVVVQLLQVFKEASGRAERRQPLGSPQLIKYSSLTLHFQSAHLPSAEVEKTATAAVWGAPQQRRATEGEEGERTVAAGLDSCGVMRHAKPLLIAGDPEEYAAELEELVLSLVYGRYGGGGFGGAGERPTKVLRLLGYVEDEGKFMKFLKRDFASYIPAAGDVGNEPPKAAISGEVVDLTMEVEEEQQQKELSCFDVLKACISNLNTASEPKARAAREPPKRKRDDQGSKEEAETGAPRKYGPGASSGPGEVITKEAAEEMAGQFLQSLGGPSPAAPPAAASGAALEGVARATGRGKTILPAWMTNKDGPSMAGPAIAAPAPAPASSTSSSSSSATVPLPETESKEGGSFAVAPDRHEAVAAVSRGSGRGTTLLPAWMTSKDGPSMAGPPVSSSSSSSSSSSAAADQTVGCEEGGAPSPAVPPAAASGAALEGVARATGRGKTILPAWMTNKDGPSMAGPAIAAPAPAPAPAPALEPEKESRKRARTDAEEGEGADGGAGYVDRLRQRVEDFLLSLVIEVVQDNQGQRRVSEQEAADMIKYIVRTLIEAD